MAQYFFGQSERPFEVADAGSRHIELKDAVKAFGEFEDGISERALAPVVTFDDRAASRGNVSIYSIFYGGECLFIRGGADDVNEFVQVVSFLRVCPAR